MGSSPTDVVAFAGDDVIRDYIEKYSNWGRWGEEDQRGALNHIGPQQLTAAAGLVWQGKVISMGLPLDLHGLQSGGFRGQPVEHDDRNGHRLPGREAGHPAGRLRPLQGIWLR